MTGDDSAAEHPLLPLSAYLFRARAGDQHRDQPAFLAHTGAAEAQGAK